MLLAAEKFDTRRKLDRDMFQHVVYVSNRVLMILKQDGISWESTTKAGKYVWRLLRVIQAYNHKRRDVTLREIVNIVTEFKSVFIGS